MQHTRQGQSLVEFALLATLLITLLLGLADFGLVLYTKIVLKNAIAEGGYWAFQHPHDDITVRNVIIQEAAKQGIAIPSPSSAISISCTGATGQEQTTIVLSYNKPLMFTFIIPSSLVRVGDRITMPQLGGC